MTAMRPADLPALPEPPQAELKQRILTEYLRNPFLDEDLQALSIRLGAARADLASALSGLCHAHFLKQAGARGYMLDLALVSESRSGVPAGPTEKVVTLPGEALVAQLDPIPQGSLPTDLVDALPFGVILLHASGTLEFANSRVR